MISSVSIIIIIFNIKSHINTLQMESDNSATNQNVFQCIGKLVQTIDFQNAQVAFYEANSSKFEDIEENKLVYTTIYC